MTPPEPVDVDPVVEDSPVVVYSLAVVVIVPVDEVDPPSVAGSIVVEDPEVASEDPEDAPADELSNDFPPVLALTDTARPALIASA